MPAQQMWQLCDSQGTALAELTTAAGKSLDYQRNRYTEARCTISHEDAAASLLIDSLNATGVPTLKVWRQGRDDITRPLRLNAYLAPFTETLEESATLELVFRSPFGRLVGDGADRGRFTGELVDFPQPGTDAGGIAKQLIDTANTEGTTGLVTTTVEATKLRLRTFQYANVGEEITGLSELLDGFDFWEDPIDGGTAMAIFNVVARLGQDVPAARFEYGPDTLSNVRAVSRTTQPPITKATILGANGLVSVKYASSFSVANCWPIQVSASDVSEQAILDEKALALLRPFPVKTIDFAPDFGLSNCPQPWDDFWIGDTVRFYGRRGAFVESVSVRLNALTIAVDEQGFETVEIPDPVTPGEEAVIRSNLSVEVL